MFLKIFLSIMVLLFFFNPASAKTEEKVIGFVKSHTSNVPWEANTGWLEIPNTGVAVRSYCLASAFILNHNYPIKFSIEYDPTQVYAGNQFTVNIKAEALEPQGGGGPALTYLYTPPTGNSLDSRFGAEVKLQAKYQGEVYDIWSPTEDMAINIQEKFKTPLEGESQEGRDSLSFLNLVPEIKATTPKIKVAYGALKLAAPALELFGGLKIEGKDVRAKVIATGATERISEGNCVWTKSGFVYPFQVKVHPEAKPSRADKIAISFSDTAYNFTLYKQMGMQLTLTLIGEVASTPKDFWECVGDISINGPAFSFEIPVVPGPPTSEVNPLPPKVNTLSFPVSWSGNSEAVAYDIQYRETSPGSGPLPSHTGPWTDWLTNTTLTSSIFTGKGDRYVYAFRSRARNLNNLWEEWPVYDRADTQTQIALVLSVSGRVKDTNNNSISGARVFISDELSTISDNSGNYTLTNLSPGHYSIQISHPNWIFSPSYKGVELSTNNVTNVDFVGFPPAPISTASSYVLNLTYPQTNTSFTVRWTGTNATMYDIQYKDDVTGAWTNWLTNTTLTSATFTGVNGRTYYFRSRAKDPDGVWEEYSNFPDAYTTIYAASGLRITAVSPTTINLEWDLPYTNQGFIRYEVHKCLSSQVNQNFGLDSSTLYTSISSYFTNTCVVQGLQPSTNYVFVVRIVGGPAAGRTNIVQGTTLASNASSSVNPLPPTITSASFVVSWSGQGAVAYDVQYKDNPSGTWTDWLKNTLQTQAIFPPQGMSLNSGHIYYFRCRAKDSSGIWENYPQEPEGDTHTTIGTATSCATSQINPLPAYQPSGTFTLTWTGQNAVSYNVEYKDGLTGSWQVLRANDASGAFTIFNDVDKTQANIQNWAPGHTYYFRCRAKDSSGIWEEWPNGAAGDTYTTVGSTTQIRSWVEALPAVTTTNSFMVRWTGTNCASYVIEVRDGSNGSWTIWKNRDQSTTGWAYFTGVNGHTYYFRSRGYNAQGQIEAQAHPEADTFTLVDTSPKVSSHVAPLPAITSSPYITIRWMGVATSGFFVSAYDVQYKDGQNGTWTNWLTGTTQTQAVFTGENGHTYYFRCRAQDSTGLWESYPEGADGDTYTKVQLPTSVAGGSTKFTAEQMKEAIKSAEESRIKQESKKEEESKESQDRVFKQEGETLDRTKTISSPAIIDVSLEELNLPREISVGDRVEVLVKARNNSNIKVDNCLVILETEDGFKEKKEISLKPKGLEKINFIWFPKQLGRQKITASLEYKDDANRRNNQLTQRIEVKSKEQEEKPTINIIRLILEGERQGTLPSGLPLSVILEIESSTDLKEVLQADISLEAEGLRRNFNQRIDNLTKGRNRFRWELMRDLRPNHYKLILELFNPQYNIRQRIEKSFKVEAEGKGEREEKTDREERTSRRID